ncbi:phosphonate ABC transporter permease [Bacillus cereus]|nr:phosphonate ABC transporter permease [Bacillus cereus]MCU4929948.1 phosphonate ABC transporter permease [Bacillus cereus]OPA06073.1 phosphonate ABC transporter permease [Bacillus cereus]
MPFLGSVYQIFGLYPELYYGMISAELQEEAQKEHLENSIAEAEAEE